LPQLSTNQHGRDYGQNAGDIVKLGHSLLALVPRASQEPV
jgi:hypothetical protein